MNFFESFSAPDRSVGKSEKETLEANGLDGMCIKCEGQGRVRPGFLKEKKICGECHGKGFIKKETFASKGHYGWDTGGLH